MLVYLSYVECKERCEGINTVQVAIQEYHLVEMDHLEVIALEAACMC